MTEKESYKGRILCVTSNFPRWPGDSTTPFVKDLADDLSGLGWKIDVLAPHAPDAQKIETINKLNITRFQYFLPTSQQTVCYQGGALINLRKSFWNKVKLPFLVMAEFLAMTRLLLKHDYDLIHAHWILPQGFNAVLLGKLFRVPVMITVHGGDVFGLKGNVLTALKRWSLKSATAVTVNSQFTAQAVTRITKMINNLQVIPMGISTVPLSQEEKETSEKLRKKYRRGLGPLLVFAGRLVEEKGVPDLLQSIALLKDRLTDTTALIIGEGQEKQNFETLAGSLGITNRVTFTGWIQPGALRSYLAAADFFVGPSKTADNGWVEAQGLIFLEAMNAGTVVIATNSGGIPESVIDGLTGFLVNESSPEQISDVISIRYQDKQAMSKIPETAGNHVKNGFSRQITANNFSKLIGSLSI